MIIRRFIYLFFSMITSSFVTITAFAMETTPVIAVGTHNPMVTFEQTTNTASIGSAIVQLYTSNNCLTGLIVTKSFSTSGIPMGIGDTISLNGVSIYNLAPTTQSVWVTFNGTAVTFTGNCAIPGSSYSCCLQVNCISSPCVVTNGTTFLQTMHLT